MPVAKSRARAVWNGSLTGGKGTVSGSSGQLKDLPLTWAARSERQTETSMTSPEELLAAAHAACFAMALSSALAKNGTEADELDVTATTSFVAGTGVTTTLLQVQGRVPGIDRKTFEELAQGAKSGCPISQALKGNVEIRLEAELAS